MSTHHRRNLRPGSTLTSFIVLFTLFGMIFGAALDARAGDFAANPTQEPTREPIDDVVANPTEEPTREPIDDVVSNPTEVPTREPVDDVVANPTGEPTREPLDEAIPTTGTVRVEKRDCPLGIVETATLAEYLYLCPQEHNGVEFVVNDVNGAQAGVTAGGVVEWTGVDPGVFNITETLPAGYTDPLVFCGYTESPGGGVLRPSLQDATGGVVAGTFPDTMFEYVCYWMNIKDTSRGLPGADDVAIAEQDRTADLLLMKHTCDNDIPPGQGPAYYIEHCTEVVDGIEFTVTHANGSSTKPIAGGEATWSGIPLGPFTVDEDIPVQYGEPIVFCGWTAIYEGVAYDAFAQLVPSPGGTVELEVSIPGAFHFCYYFNVKGVDDLADPSARDNTLVTRKWDCPDGTLGNQPDRDYYFERCSLMLDPVQFTLTNANGDDTKATSGGFAEWAGVPLGEFTLTEEIPAGYGRPTVFCGWYAFFDGYHYDAFPQLVILAAANVIDGNITIPNTDYFCDVFNIAGEIDDFQANPTGVPAIDDVQGNATAGTVRLVKRDCPIGIVETATLAEYLKLCPQLHDGVDFSLETSSGVMQETTAMGEAQWTGVPSGEFAIQEEIPAGYKDPLVFCGYTESAGGGVQHPALVESAGGLVEGEFPDGMFEYVCFWMNLDATEQVFPGADDIANAGGGGNSTLMILNVGCPGSPEDTTSLDVLDGICGGDVNGFTFEVTHANGSSIKPITDGHAHWQGLPLAPYTIDEAVPLGYGDPQAYCHISVIGHDDSWVHSESQFFEAAVGGTIELAVDLPDDVASADVASMQTRCTFYNFAAEAGSFAQPQETSNSLTVRKWICPGDTESVADQDYLESQCSLSTIPVEFTLTNADGASSQATDPAWTTWENVPLGEFSLQETIPDGYNEPIVFCEWTAFYNGLVYDDFSHVVPSAGGLVEGEITIPNTNYACDFYNIATSVGVGGPDSVVANPGDESNTLVAHKWFCPEGIAADAHLLDYFEQCQLADTPVEFTLTNDDGVAVQETVDGTATWEDVPLGEFTLKEAAGYQVLVVWCGWTAFHDGAVYDAFSQPKESQDGLVIGEISVPNTHYRCDFINAPVAIDDLQANPTQAPTEEPIDDVVANPGPASLTISLAECMSDGIPGDDIYSEDVEFFSEWCDVFSTEFEFTVASEGGFSETQTTSGFGVTFAEVPVAPITITETIPPGWDDPMSLCWSDQVDPSGWHIGNDATWSVVSGEQIECLWVNVTGSVEPFFRADAAVCPPGFDTDVTWMDVFYECNIPINGVEFAFTDASGSSSQPLNGVFVQWNQVGIGEGQTVELVEEFPAGYTDPLVLCSSWPTAAGDPFDWDYQPVEVNGGAISVAPNLDGGQGPNGMIQPGIGYDCTFFHFALAEADDVVANPTERPTEEPIDDVVANPTDDAIDDVQANPTGTGTLIVHAWICPPAYDPLDGDALADCTESQDGVTFDLVNHAEGEPDFQATTGDEIAGTAVFEPQAGTYSLKEQIPDGYGVPFLWQCTGLAGALLEPPISTINFFRIVIDSGQVIECDWMNVPVDPGLAGADDLQANPAPYRINVYPMVCAEGVGPDDDRATLVDACDWYDGDVLFTLTNEGGTYDYLAEYGSADWDDVALGANGTVQIHEAIPAGYEEVTAWCFNMPLADLSEDFGYEQALATDGTITVQPDPVWPHTFSCFFYNFAGEGITGADDIQANPIEGGTVRIVARDCPAGVDEDTLLLISQALDTCTEAHDGVTFTLNHARGSEAGVTAGGEVAWSGVPLGEYEIVETLPNGYAVPIVHCGFTESPGGGVQHPAVQTADDEIVNGSLDVAGAEFVCYWLNIPLADEAGTTGPYAFTSQPGYAPRSRLDLAA